MQPVFLITDLFVYGILLFVLWYMWHVRSDRNLLANWRLAMRRPVAMVSSMVLGFFLVVALADTLLEQALDSQNEDADGVARAGAAFVGNVPLKTTVLLLRLQSLAIAATVAIGGASAIIVAAAIPAANAVAVPIAVAGHSCCCSHCCRCSHRCRWP